MTGMTNDATTAEGTLLHAALLRHKPLWKAPQLADAAGMKTDWTRAILRGYRSTGKGQRETVIPKPEVLAALANALGNISENDLRRIGRADAAHHLATLRETADSDASPTERWHRIRDELDSLIRDLTA